MPRIRASPFYYTLRAARDQSLGAGFLFVRAAPLFRFPDPAPVKTGRDTPRRPTRDTQEANMTHRSTFQNVFPIGETDTDALPVREIGPAIGYYTNVLGF